MLTLSIQAGGQSNRMGRDKATLYFLGQPLIQRVIQRIAHLADETQITSNRPESLQFLGIPIIPDLIPGVGPLGGLYTALKSASYPLVAVVACDLPFVNQEILTACQEILKNTNADSAIPSSQHGLEPLHAVYRRDTCLPLIENALQSGQRKLISWHEHASIHILPQDLVLQYDPIGICFWNLNTPQEFRQAEAKARMLEEN